MTGRIVLHYELTRKLGSGGMGVVWKARDTRLGREVALKFLPGSSTSDPLRRERFLREARAASALNHPNIVTIYEIDSDAGQLFIAMELIRGRSLSAILRDEHRLSASVVTEHAIQICSGVGAAHRAGIVHRDIKPSNIMVAQDGAIKVLDFGLAKSASLETPQVTFLDAPLSVEGAVMGTVPYMS